ncbi:hypothetical protein K2173_018118 [Erythroxylum novogranatense]|uniref:Pentatricopeptide repeat (PPR) superfamily protein n=1 Tax=Erythroxylum novogranatense TaxID=1862640 RepID=A0AAV8U9N0_9ROSI|nr:hypothetical protein K2173_018118 [Erythroxylum novogranatense]
MVIAAASSLFLGHLQCQLCHSDGVCCSTSYGITNSWIKSSIDNGRDSDFSSIGCRNPFFGSTQFHWSSVGRDLCHLKVSVAADYSDSVPDSTNYTSLQGYHPLEELKINKRVRETHLTSAEIARTTLEANTSALLVFPGSIHHEPHEEISWAEYQYVIDDYGDICFEIFDDENILYDREASNPVNMLIGMDIPMYGNKRIASEYNVFKTSNDEDTLFDDDYLEVMVPEVSDVPVDWGMPDTCSWIHPFYFAKCLTKATQMEYDRKMEHPSNGVSIVGYLRPAFSDEESYLRNLFHGKDSNGYDSDWKGEDISSFGPINDGSSPSSTLYRLEIMGIELFSVYGNQSVISLQDFQDAEPDVLVHSTSAILEHFSAKGIRFNVALKALCKKKGLHVEGANLIGVDSLGMDVRIFSGVEVRTHRFPFKVRATCETAAEKRIQQLLFPRSHRKKPRNHGDGFKSMKSL